MLRRDQRFRRAEFSLCFQKGKKATGKLMRVIIGVSSPLPKGSVVISKKVSGSAVTRNLLRRRIYSIFEETNRTKDSIVVLFPEAKTASYEALKREYTSLIT